MQVFFCMVDKKNPARRGAGKRSVPGLRFEPGFGKGRRPFGEFFQIFLQQKIRFFPAVAGGDDFDRFPADLRFQIRVAQQGGQRFFPIQRMGRIGIKNDERRAVRFPEAAAASEHVLYGIPAAAPKTGFFHGPVFEFGNFHHIGKFTAVQRNGTQAAIQLLTGRVAILKDMAGKAKQRVPAFGAQAGRRPAAAVRNFPAAAQRRTTRRRF